MLSIGSRAATPGWNVAARFPAEAPLAGACDGLPAPEGDAEDQSLQHQLDPWRPESRGFGWHAGPLLHSVSVSVILIHSPHSISSGPVLHMNPPVLPARVKIAPHTDKNEKERRKVLY